MKRRVGLVFISGRFRCLAKNLALLEVGKVVGELVGRFEMSVVNHAGDECELGGGAVA